MESSTSPPSMEMGSPHPYVETLTPRLRIRNMTDSVQDAADMHTLRRRAEVMQWTNTTPETSLSQTYTWLRESILNNPSEIYNFVIELRDPSSYILFPPNGDFTMRMPRRVIGMIGAVGRSEVGYMVHPAYAGQGLATEALRGFMPLYWAWRTEHKKGRNESGQDENTQPSECVKEGSKSAQEDEENSIEYDYVDADTDTTNYASHRVLLKCGFVEWDRTNDDFHSPVMGLRSTVKFRLARPGTQLKSKEEDERRKNEAAAASGIA